MGWPPRGQGYLVAASSAARVRFRPTLTSSSVVRRSGTNRLGSIRVSSRSDCALPSKPPQSCGDLVQRLFAVVPEGRVARGRARGRPSRPGPGRSRVPRPAPGRPGRIPGSASAGCGGWRPRLGCVVPGVTTWVLPASRRSAAECSTRARSRWKAVRPGRLSGSGAQRSTSGGVIARRVDGVGRGSTRSRPGSPRVVSGVPMRVSRAASARAASTRHRGDQTVPGRREMRLCGGGRRGGAAPVVAVQQEAGQRRVRAERRGGEPGRGRRALGGEPAGGGEVRGDGDPVPPRAASARSASGTVGAAAEA